MFGTYHQAAVACEKHEQHMVCQYFSLYADYPEHCVYQFL